MATDNKHPRVSVLMPVYNAGRFLPAALDSILQQTFTDFELIAIDDGSHDDSGTILDEYAARDNRLRVVHQTNKGLVATLNKAIDISRGDYLARQDGDDISFPTRFEQEVAILDQNDDVVLVTGSFEVFDEEDEYLYREVLPADDADIRRSMLLRNPIGHGSVMFRKSACLAVGKYSADCGPTEDFELWARLAKVGKIHAIEQAMFRWRINATGITSTKNDLQIKIMKQHIAKLWEDGFPPLVSTPQLRNKGKYYRQTYHKRGIAMKNIMLADNAQLAIKMIKHGKILRGLGQIISVMLVGRSGLRAVFYRIHTIQRGTIAAIRRRMIVGRPDVARTEIDS